MATLTGPSVKIIKAHPGQAPAKPSPELQDAHYPGTDASEHAVKKQLVDGGRGQLPLRTAMCWRLQTCPLACSGAGSGPQPHPGLIALLS